MLQCKQGLAWLLKIDHFSFARSGHFLVVSIDLLSRLTEIELSYKKGTVCFLMFSLKYMFG